MSQVVDAVIQAGKANAGPPLGPALGPSGVNVKGVIEEINKVTASMEGMQVPVKVIVEDDKTFKLEIGTPPTSSLIKMVLGIEKGSGEAGTVVAADITIEQAITVAKQKASGLSGADLMAQASEVLGVAKSMGLSSEGKDPKVIQAAMKAGEYSDKF